MRAGDTARFPAPWAVLSPALEAWRGQRGLQWERDGDLPGAFGKS